MKQYISGNLHSLTNIGKVRETNEDFAGARINAYGQLLLIVCDGMGGRNKGDYASKTLGEGLIKAFLDLDKQFEKPAQATKWLYKTANALNRKIFDKAKSDETFKGMGTTLTAAIIFDSHMIVAQAGDSRLYILKDKELTQLTVDQTYVQHLENIHKLSKEQIAVHPERHKLTNAIGIRYNALIDIKTYEYSGENVFLCSDGLYNNVPLQDLKSILRGNDSIERKGAQLVAFGNANGGTDNMALVIWENSKR